MGRYMVAKKSFNPGDVILYEPPLVIGPCSSSGVQCTACYKPLSAITQIFKCPECGWPLCSSTCAAIGAEFGHSFTECQHLSAAQSRQVLNYNDFDSLATFFNVLAPLRCLILKKSAPEKYAQLMEMETHNNIRQKITDLWHNNQVCVVDKIRNELQIGDFSEEEIHSVCGVLEVNSFDVGQGVSVRGIYPTAFLLSHDCIPNTSHCHDPLTYFLTIRASTPIAPQHAITLSYTHTVQSTLKRREHLLENKFFHCQCKRCTDPSELGTYTGALLCPKCRSNVLPRDALNSDSTWGCTNPKCLYSLTANNLRLLLDKISMESEAIGCNDVTGMEAFLDKYRNVLHPSHYLCLAIKLSLSQIYGKIVGFMIYELSDEQLMRKLEVCEEILRVFDLIEPGCSRLRGVTLYETHAPLMVLLTRHFEPHCKKSKVRGKLKRIVRCLEEAATILGLEPVQTAEGAMGVAARDALVKIRDWEKILGRF